MVTRRPDLLMIYLLLETVPEVTARTRSCRSANRPRLPAAENPSLARCLRGTFQSDWILIPPNDSRKLIEKQFELELFVELLNTAGAVVVAD
jgi:hypothetical protein